MLPEDKPTFQITRELFNGENFIVWSQYVKLFLKSKGKMGYVLGTIEQPKPTDHPDFNNWEAENSKVMIWLLNSMVPDIANTCLFLSTAKEIWDTLVQTYTHVGDVYHMYGLRVRIQATKQVESSVTTYFNQLHSLWQEFDYYNPIEMESEAETIKLKKLIEKERIFEFLAGLNTDMNRIKYQILDSKPLPSLFKVYGRVLAEERRIAMME